MFLIVKAPWDSEHPKKFDWEAQLRRIKFSFANDVWKDLAEQLDCNNKLLDEFLGGSDKWISRRTVKSHELPKRWTSIPERASSLFDALVSSWNCCCPAGHWANLYLEGVSRSRSTNEYLPQSSHFEGNFKLWFSFGSSLDNLSWDWHHAEVRTILLPSPHFLQEESCAVLSKQVTPEKGRDQVTKYTKLKFSANWDPREEPFPQLKPRVVIQDTEATISGDIVDQELVEIMDLCSTLQSCCRKQSSIGFLKSSKQYRHELYGRPRPCLSGDILSLAELLSSKNFNVRNARFPRSLKLSRNDRTEISIQISSALLLLYTTPWISAEWNGRDVVFEHLQRTHSSSSLLYPYFSRRFSTASGCLLPSSTSTKSTREIVFRLGVLLLELCMGQTLEDHCEEIGRSRTTESEFDIVSEWWEQEAETAEGPEVAEVIKKCLFFKFQTGCRSLFDEELRRAIYNEVVQPLREVPRNFNTD